EVIREEIVKLNPSVIIEGGARGADKIAREIAIELEIDVMEYPAEWDKYGEGAGPIRNQQMLDEAYPNLVLAFPLPDSRGTWDMIRRARAAGIEVKIIENSP
ncbi:hypothetical protein LCGC14_2564270, partial [marine sediment metagenome]